MNNLFLTEFLFGNENFGLNVTQSRPAFYIFGFEIYLYAICIVTGMCLAILIAALFFKKRGIDPYDATIYALVLIPIGVLGARAYVYIFPWGDRGVQSWDTFFDFRNGGLGIYGGVAAGFFAAMITAKIRKQDFRIIMDSIIPGVLLAQSLGRWGNFANQEAYGNLITNAYDGLAHAQSGLFSKFNGIAVWIDAYHAGSSGAGWYQATFFYESFCTFVGFLICVLVLTRSKKYKLGWCTSFYGIYYGIARLVIEGMRTDSLFLFIGEMKTDIKISQLVSIFSICLAVWTLTKIYRKDLHALYRKFFKNERDELDKSRIVLAVLATILLGVGITMFALGGEFKFIIGFVCAVLAIYSILGIFSITDRLKLYCNGCGERIKTDIYQSDYSKYRMQTLCYGVIMGALITFGLFALIKWGLIDGVSNGVVLAVVCLLVTIACAIFAFVPACNNMLRAKKEVIQLQSNCKCGTTQRVQLNSFFLFVFPPKVYLDYGVSHLKPWVDPEVEAKKNKKAKVADNQQ